MSEEAIYMDFVKVLGYILFVSFICYFAVFTFTEGKSVIRGFKGKDDAWQWIETAGIAWIIVFVHAAAMDIFLHSHSSKELWISLDGVALILSGAKAYKHGVDVKHTKSKNDETESLGSEGD